MDSLIKKYNENMPLKVKDFKAVSDRELIEFYFFKIKYLKKNYTRYAKKTLKNAIIMDLNRIRKLKNKKLLAYV